MAASLNRVHYNDQHRSLHTQNKLCYHQPMTIARTLLATLLLLTLSGSLWAQSSGGRLASELNLLRQQQRQMERDISQYETSIKLLRANQKTPGEQNATLDMLETQLQQSQANLAAITLKEQEYKTKLMPAAAIARADTSAEDYDPEAAEVARLKFLLASYHIAEAQAEAQASAINDEVASAAEQRGRGDSRYPLDKVYLSGSEAREAILDMDRRLVDDAIAGQYRELDIIFHIEVRDEGKLVSSSSHSLKSLGKAQYISKVSLRGGSATISVRKDSWVANLSIDEASDYLITLNLPRSEAPELHVISVEELKATQLTEVPPWVPYIGSLAPAQS